MAMVPVKLVSGDVAIDLEIDDQSATARGFLQQLPLQLVMTEYGGREYYGMIKPLSEDGPHIPTFHNGDVTYYTLGKSLAIYYDKDDSSTQGDLIKIGRVTSGIDQFKQLGSTAEVTLTRE